LTLLKISGIIYVEVKKTTKNKRKEENIMLRVTRDYVLECRNDSRNSFYGKAKVNMLEDGRKVLLSYNENVAEISSDGRNARVNGSYSKTTTRHIKEFLRQEGFNAENMKQMLKDYSNNV
jgi:hypothetical protein